MLPVRSMTGFGAATVPCGGGALTLEVRSVNHRFVEARTRAPGQLADVQASVEEALKKRAQRGHLEIGLRLDEGATDTFDHARLASAARELAALRDAIAPGEPLPWALLASAGIGLARKTTVDADTLRSAAEAAVERAGEALDAMRLREGAALAAELLRLLQALEFDVDAIEAAVPAIVIAHRDKLRQRVRALLDAPDPKIAEGRLELEIALLADKMDVTEELARARSHLSLFRELCAADEPVGRKLDFVTQELLREVNTIGSKNADAALAHRVIALKATIERLREQVQNVL